MNYRSNNIVCNVRILHVQDYKQKARTYIRTYVRTYIARKYEQIMRIRTNMRAIRKGWAVCKIPRGPMLTCVRICLWYISDVYLHMALHVRTYVRTYYTQTSGTHTTHNTNDFH